MTKTNKLAKIISLFMVISMLLACTAIFVSAGDNSDEGYSYSFSTNVKYTKGREKLDDTSCYMYYQSGSVTYTASAYGQLAENSTSHVDCSGGFLYRFTSAHQARFMYNYVWETNEKTGQTPYISIKGSCTTSGNCYGVWSPDSVYQAGVLPAGDYIKG